MESTSELLTEQLKRHEGFSRIAYADTVGVLTIGYGHNLKEPISEEVAELMLKEDVYKALVALKSVAPWCSLHPTNAKLVLGDMCFNLGAPRLSKFKKFLAAMEAQDYPTAVKEMRNSKWYSQVGVRAKNLEKMLLEIKQ